MYAAGATSSTVALFLRQYDAAGNSLWLTSTNVPFHPANGVSASSSGIYTVSVSSSSGSGRAFVRRFDSSGALQWIRTVGSLQAQPSGNAAVVADSTGATVVGSVVGAFPGFTFAGTHDVFAMRFDTAGNVLWTRQFGSSDSEGVYSVVRDGASFVFAGTTAGALPGQAKTTGVNRFEGFVARVDENGNLTALRQFADGSPTTSLQAFGVSVTAGQVYVSGHVLNVSGARRGFVKRLDGDFSDVWTRKFGAQGAEVFPSSTAAQPAGVGVGGFVRGNLTTGAPKADYDGFVQLYDLDGNVRGTAQLDSSGQGQEFAHSLVWSDGALYVSGTSTGGFGGQPPNTFGRGFVAKLPVNRPPVANTGPDQTVECASLSGTAVSLSGEGSTDPDDDTLSFEWRDGNNTVRGTSAALHVSLPTGVHSFSLTVSDGRGGTATDTVEVTVRDTIAPTIAVALSPNVLWPANNKMVAIAASITATDACSAPAVTFESIVSNETLGAGDIADAAAGTDDRSFSLRATRRGQGVGRTYTVTYRAADAAGNSSVRTAVVQVPHNQ